MPAMNAERWAKIKSVFYAASDRPENERAAFIRAQCDGDESLALEIEALLDARDQANSFIETIPADALPDMPATMVGQRIGAYEVIREIGHGGMGTVYQAKRADGEYRKTVALKLIRRGMDSDFIIHRFRTERQILAELDHPNIAKLLDGGSTDDGLPYFVMEYVDGAPSDQYCDTNKLSIRERLNLFRTVCSAVHHAHQHSIVHRDIKPSNILVCEQGPKLLDFGIAKLLEPGPAADTLDSTATAIRLMTPEYASPEQIRGEPITARTDVYTLGVLLYELLTGHRPYRLKNRSPLEIAGAICEQEPERPSTVISKTEEVTGTAGKVIKLTPEFVSRTRAVEPGRLRKLLGGDLDAIVLMAMRKQPDDRYPTVEEFSADIGRHLESLPVLARKEMRWGRRANMKSYVRPAAAVLVLLLVIGSLIYALKPKSTIVSSDIRSIAVLPFKPMSQDANDEYLAQGIADSLITRLSNVRTVMVRPTSAVLKYSGRDHDAVAAGRELAVDALLDGSIQKMGDRIRVTVQLLRTSDGTPLWAYKCDDRCTNIFDVQDSISEKTVAALLLKLTNEERRLLAKRPTENQEAYEAYIKGRYFLE